MPVNLDRQMLHQVISNIVRNALQAVSPHGDQGRIEVAVTAEREAFSVTIDDNGPGVPEAMRDSVFDPYVTTKAEGTGLGLAIARQAVWAHDGTVNATSTLGKGTEIQFTIPANGVSAVRTD